MLVLSWSSFTKPNHPKFLRREGTLYLPIVLQSKIKKVLIEKNQVLSCYICFQNEKQMYILEQDIFGEAFFFSTSLTLW